ncbi:hypothetical protein R70241_00044 [Paraburkholderia saeva]|nr:hypothetical protein R70241_00044 [Paraburkholderia saeva]
MPEWKVYRGADGLPRRRSVTGEIGHFQRFAFAKRMSVASRSTDVEDEVV